jgi:alanine racemase
VGGTGHARLGIGFADGIPTIGIAKAHVAIGGIRRQVVSVEADSMLVDVGADRIRVGDTAIVFGPGVNGEPIAEKWADWAETIGDEMVTGVSSRVPRVYIG